MSAHDRPVSAVVYGEARQANLAIRVLKAISNWLVAIFEWRVRRAAASALRGLSDHLLQDIGLTRQDIDAAVEGLLSPHHFDGPASSASRVIQMKPMTPSTCPPARRGHGALEKSNSHSPRAGDHSERIAAIDPTSASMKGLTLCP